MFNLTLPSYSIIVFLISEYDRFLEDHKAELQQRDANLSNPDIHALQDLEMKESDQQVQGPVFQKVLLF